MINISQNIISKTTPKLLGVVFIFIAAFLLFSTKAQAQQTDGGYAEAYLFRDVGARVNAMAGAYTAIVNEPIAIFYNPAGIGFLTDRPIVTSSVSSLGFGRTQSSLAWAQEILPGFGVGVGINSLFTGEFTARDVRGNPIGEYSDFQYSMVAAASYRLESSSIGIAMKYLTSNLIGSPTSANGYGIDIGTKFHILDMFSVGVAVQNISGMMFWNNLQQDIELIPYSVRSGIAMEFPFNDRLYETRSTVTGELETIYEPATRYLLVGLDAVLTQHRATPDLILGVEAALHEVIALRGGISLYGENKGTPQFLPFTKWGGGVSIRPQNMEAILNIPFNMNIDYTVSPEYLSNTGITHHISLVFEF